MNDLLLGICLSRYPGLRNTCAELPKVVCSSCFKILRIHFKIIRKTQEIAFQGFPISKFSRWSMPPNPPRYLAPSPRDCPPPPNFNSLAPPLHLLLLGLIVNPGTAEHQNTGTVKFRNTVGVVQTCAFELRLLVHFTIRI